jgi:phosphatidate phosphatase APP1
MNENELNWKRAAGVSVLWVGTVAVFAIPLAWMVIYTATQIAYRVFASGVAWTGAGRFIATVEIALLVCSFVVLPSASGLAHRSWRVTGLVTAFVAVGSFWIGIVLYSFYLHYALPVIMNAERKALSSEATTATSDIHADEEVVLFPTSAHFDEARGTWSVPIHGIIYEPEGSSLARDAMVAAISELLDVKAGTPEAENLDRRVRLFLADNERGQDICVRIGSQAYAAGTSGANGHFQKELRFSTSEIDRLRVEPTIDGSFLVLEAVTRQSDDRRFIGRVQLVDPTGLSVISDIDDTIKHSQVGDHRAVLANTFLHRFKPVPGMPELYRDCARKGLVFHYVSGSPWQLYLPLAEFLAAEGLPSGSFDLKHFRLKDKSAIGLLQSQEATKLPAIERILTAFPQRRFILIGDSGEQDPEIYAKAAAAHRGQVVGIFIRNVTGETIGNARFEAIRNGIANEKLVLFDRPAELQPVIDEVRAREQG